MLTLADLENEVTYAVGNPQREKSVIVNDAGRHLYSMHQWRFAIRTINTIATVASQQYVELPSDFGSFIGEPQMSSYSSTINLVTLDEINALRVTTSTSVKPIAGAVAWVPGGNQRGLIPRLELYPTPSAASTISMSYRRRWKELAGANDIAEVPEYAETLLKELIRAFAKGYDEDDVMSLSERLSVLSASVLLYDVKCADGLAGGSFGEMEGGAIQGSFASYRGSGLSLDSLGTLPS